uniref:Movement protein n=1 Tax=Andean potato latent virus TaxID=73819 RepID=A0A8E7IWC9_9VIRU|nr:movement protein [Andean potato latent virus]
MSNVFSNSSRSLELHSSSRRSNKSDTELCCRASPTVSCSVPMAPSKRSPSLPPVLRNSQLWLGNHSSSSPHSQSHRDFPPLQPLVLPCKPALHHHVHETSEVPKTSESEQQFHPSLQLSAHSSRHHKVSHHLPTSSKHSRRLHARRPHVFQSSSNSGSLPQLPDHQLALLQSDRSSRVRLHRPVSSANPLPVLNLRADSPLCPGRPQRRQLQPAPARSRLAQDPQHPLTRTQPLSDQAGLLGPGPLHSHPEKPPSSSSSSPVSHQSLSLKSLSSAQSRPSCTEKPKRLFPAPSKRPPGFVPTSSSCSCPGILQNPGMPRAPLSHLSKPTSPPSSSPTASLQCSLHLHSSCPHTSHIRPCWIRANSKQQSRVLMGDSKCLGQSTNLRSHECSHPPSSVLRVFPQPLPETKTPFSSALEKVPYPFFPCDFDFGYFTSTPPNQVPHPKTPASLHFPQSKTALLSHQAGEPSLSQEIPSTKAHPKKKFLHSYTNRSWQHSAPSSQNQSIPRPSSTHSTKVPDHPRSLKGPSSKSFHHHPTTGAGPNLHHQLAPSLLGAPPPTNPRSLPHQHAPLPVSPAMGFATNACRLSSTLPSLPPPRAHKSLHISPNSSSSDSSYLSASSSESHTPASTKPFSKLSSRIRASNRLGFLLNSSPFFNYSSDSSSSS